MRYAAAAVITGLIVLGGSLFFFKGNKETGNRALTKFTKDVKKMDEQQKENLADFVAAGMDGREVAKNGIKTEEVKQLLQDIPEDELREFEQQTEDLEGIVLTN
jgi:hypothetical protein